MRSLFETGAGPELRCVPMRGRKKPRTNPGLKPRLRRERDERQHLDWGGL